MVDRRNHAMSLRVNNGRLLASSGHLCTTCCAGKCGHNCIDFSLYFPLVMSGTSPAYSHRGYTCAGSIPAATAYSRSFSNPLTGAAILVVTREVFVDDDLEVDGVSIGGPCSTPIIIPSGTVLATKEGGGIVTLTVVDNYSGRTGGTGCACWVSSATIPQAALPTNVAIATKRFQICRACADSLEEGFGCSHYSGCCLGRRRSDPGFSCPDGKW